MTRPWHAALLASAALVAGLPAVAADQGKADLFLKDMQFIDTTRRDLRVLVANAGRVSSVATEVRLTLRAGAQEKSIEVKLRGIPPGRGLWLMLEPGAILPPKTFLRTVPFSVLIDPRKKVDDGDRSNNETIYNPK